MFSRIAFLASFAVLAVVAHPTNIARDAPSNQCNTGNMQCCNSVQRADSSFVGALLASVGAVVEGAEALVGITCAPIDILGIGQGAQCHNQPVCCENNNFNGVVAIGCTPINVRL